MGDALAPNRHNSVPCTVQLEIPDKDRAIKGLFVCNNWDLEPLDLLNGLALGCYQPSLEVLDCIIQLIIKSVSLEKVSCHYFDL